MINNLILNQSSGADLDDIQDQLDGKLDKSYTGNPTTDSVGFIDTSGKLNYTSTPSNKLAYIDNVTDDIQTQLDGKPNSSEVWAKGDTLKGTGTNLFIKSSAGKGWQLSSSGFLRPSQPGTDLGYSNSVTRIGTVYATSWDAPSDKRLKNFEEYPSKLLEIWLDTVKPKYYSYKNDKDNKKKFGVIAQDVIKAFDLAGLNWEEHEAVRKNDEGMLSVDYFEIHAITLAAIRHKFNI